MDNHSKVLTGRAGVVTLLILVFITKADALTICSYGRSFNYALPEEEHGKGKMDDAVIFVPVAGRLLDIDLAIDIRHSSVCDLQIYLVSPAGTRVCLNYYDVYDFQPNQVNYEWTIFNDDALVPIESAQAPFSASFRPKGTARLSVFNGENPYGSWRIQVYDIAYADSGIFRSARLDMVINPEPATVLIFCTGLFFLRAARPGRLKG